MLIITYLQITNYAIIKYKDLTNIINKSLMSYFVKSTGFSIIMYADRNKTIFTIVNDMLYDEFKNDTSHCAICIRI